MKKTGIAILVLLVSGPLLAQQIPVDDNAPQKQFPGASTIFNRIFNTGKLDSFYQKLYTVKKTGQGVVNIVHIGDSHLQADFLSSVVRKNLQQFFGNAGRGMVFPFQLAQSNSPQDITSFSNVSWQFNRIAHPEIPITAGISGYTVRTHTTGAAFDLSLRSNEFGPQSFSRLRFFTDGNSSSSWILQADQNASPYLVRKEEGDSSLYTEVVLEYNSNRFSLATLPSGNAKEFYGVSLENNNPGVLYHMIGVNGVRYDHFNKADLFWKQLPALQADLFIISLGTNEAQRTDFDNAAFEHELDLFLQKIKLVSPKAAVLITTAADSYYKKRRPNLVLRELNISLFNYCTQKGIPIWDLYRITNGYGSAYNWVRRGLMNDDRIHFTGEGYRIQGQLLFNALAKGYNNFINLIK